MSRFALGAVVLLLLVSDAAACGRCGLFGNRCKFAAAHVVAAPLVVKAPEVLVIQNAFAQPNGLALLANQGTTAYGLQAAAQAYTLDPAAVLRQAAELTRGAQSLAADGLNGFSSTASLALQLNSPANDALAKGTAAALVLQSAGLNQPGASQSQSLRIARDASGRWQVQHEEPAKAVQALERPTAEIAGDSLIKAKCAQCHGTTLSEPKGGLYLDAGAPLDCAAALKSIDAVLSGRMPKGQQLSAEEVTGLVKELTKAGGAK